jgi:hypothetical protein
VGQRQVRRRRRQRQPGEDLADVPQLRRDGAEEFAPDGRVLMALVLGLTLADGRCATAAGDPPKELSPDERKERQAR